MRLDKFLKVSTLAKRRSVAKDALAAGRVECGGKALKPSYQVKAGDELTIHYATKDLRVRVEKVPERPVSAAKAAQLFTILSQSRTG